MIRGKALFNLVNGAECQQKVFRVFSIVTPPKPRPIPSAMRAYDDRRRDPQSEIHIFEVTKFLRFMRQVVAARLRAARRGTRITAVSCTPCYPPRVLGCSADLRWLDSAVGDWKSTLRADRYPSLTW